MPRRCCCGGVHSVSTAPQSRPPLLSQTIFAAARCDLRKGRRAPHSCRQSRGHKATLSHFCSTFISQPAFPVDRPRMRAPNLGHRGGPRPSARLPGSRAGSGMHAEVQGSVWGGGGLRILFVGLLSSTVVRPGARNRRRMCGRRFLSGR